MQIEQDPGDYRVQATDGSWQTRLNKPLCRWLAILGVGVAGYFAFAAGGDTTTISLFVGVMCFGAGGLFTLSLKSLNW